MKLTIKNLKAGFLGKNILNGIDLEVVGGKIYAIMGPNGSGKSTLAQVLMGNPTYEIQNPNAKPTCASRSNPKSKILINKVDITQLSPEERAKKGLFLAFQNPVAIPGVTVAALLRTAYQQLHGLTDKRNIPHNPALSIWDFNVEMTRLAKELSINQEFLGRSLNNGFSGGEKKKIEMLQALVLKPKIAIFDEIDTGLDVDALKIVAAGINRLKKEGCGVMVITHYQRILKYLKPDYVHVLVGGKIVAEGDRKLAEEVEKNGYKKWIKN